MQTPQIKAKKLAKKIGLNADLYLKREDLHTLASHKGRSIPLMIKKHAEEGWEKFCISSSGNAALAAAYYIKQLNKGGKNILTLQIFVGKNIDAQKLKLIKKIAGKNKFISISMVDNPKQTAFQTEKNGLAKNLRQSTDDSALEGYAELAKELAKIKNLSAVFIPTSSGTTAQGLHAGFLKLGINPQIHIVQTAACHPIVLLVNADEESDAAKTGSSVASAIVDKIAHRKGEVFEAIKSSSGGAWIATDEQIIGAVNLVKNAEKIKISPNSALSIAGLIRAIKNNRTFDSPVVCLITGR